MIEQILVLTAEQVAGPATQVKPAATSGTHGSQPGRVQLTDRKVKVKRARPNGKYLPLSSTGRFASTTTSA